MDGKDVFYAAASLAALLLIVLIGVLAAVFIFFFGSPLLLLGGIGALGLLGIFALAGILAALVSAWYVIYALLKGFMSGGEKPAKPPKGGYTLGRVRKA